MAPRYQLKTDLFMAPEIIKAGSVIETDIAPGPHMTPLNAEAEARMEEWYQEEVRYTEYDPKTGIPEEKVARPHLQFKSKGAQSVPGGTTFQVLRGPASAAAQQLSLAEALASRGAANMDQRPPPASPAEDLSEFAESPVAVVEQAPDPSAKLRRTN